jgi:hypothetical protein
LGALLKWSAGVALLCASQAAMAATVGPVTDDLGVIRIAKGAPIQIGAYWVLSGADTPSALTRNAALRLRSGTWEASFSATR